MQVHVAIYSKVIEISIHLSCILFDYLALLRGYKFNSLLLLYKVYILEAFAYPLITQDTFYGLNYAYNHRNILTRSIKFLKYDDDQLR